MNDRRLIMATAPYDLTRALFDGSVGVAGYAVEMRTGPTLPGIFERMMRGREFDVSELGLTFLLREFGPDTPYLAIPVFPNRVFRHSCVFVNADSGIRGPADLTGRTIGEFGVYGQDSGVWAKGILSDDHGFRPETNRWIIGGLDRPAPPMGFVPQLRPAGIDITDAPPDRSLTELLEAAEIDALFTANVPQSVLDGSTRTIVRLFGDYETIERDYHRRTGIFPVMHTMVIARELLTRPGLARAVFDAFVAAERIARDRSEQARRLFGATLAVPWVNRLLEDNAQFFAGDPWRHGIAANRRAVETYLRYHHEQGLSERRLTVEELFVPDLLDS